MIQFYRKHGLLVYWLILLLDCYDTYYSHSENGYYIKGLEYLSLILFLVLNLKKRHHTTSKWLIFSALSINVLGSFFILIDTTNTIFFGYSFYGIANILFSIFMFRIIRNEEVSSKEPTIAGVALFIASIIVFIKTKVEFPPYTYFVYAFVIVQCIMLSASISLYAVKNKKSTAINAFIPASLLMIASDVILVILRLAGENSTLIFLRIIVLLCSGYAISLMTNGAKKVLK